MTYKKTDVPKKRMKNIRAEERIRMAEEEVNYYVNLLNLPDEIQEGMELLEDQRPLNLATIKDSCQFELQRFITMRGLIDEGTGKIHTPFLTISDNNVTLALKMAQALIKGVETAKSVEEINDILQKTSISDLSSQSLRDDLDASIGKCIVITELLMMTNGKLTPSK
jgi:hypothetical protein